MVEWRPIFGFERYEVSSIGEVRRLPSRRNLTPRIGTGYNQLALYTNGKRQHKLAHVLVFEAFCGPIKPGLVINHKNGKKLDNRVENLEAVTLSENTLHAYRVTNVMRRWLGEEHPNAVLTDDLVRKVRLERSAGASYRALEAKYGIDWTTIRLAVIRQTWVHVV